MKVLLMQDFQTAASVLKHRLPHSAKPHPRILLKVHHIGYLVKKGAPARDAFLRLGYTVLQDWVRDDGRGIDISFIGKDGTVLELVTPFREDSDVSGLLKRIKNCPYHICYISSSIEKDSVLLREAGYLPISGALPAPACGGNPVRFFLHPQLGMIELVEGDFAFRS